MAKRVKKEDTGETPRPTRRRTAAAASGSPAGIPPSLPPDAMPGVGGSADVVASESPEANAADDLAREPSGDADTVREPAEERPGHDRVARRAYEIFQQRGGQPGRDLDDWLEAERELGRRHRRK